MSFKDRLKLAQVKVRDSLTSKKKLESRGGGTKYATLTTARYGRLKSQGRLHVSLSNTKDTLSQAFAKAKVPKATQDIFFNSSLWSEIFALLQLKNQFPGMKIVVVMDEQKVDLKELLFIHQPNASSRGAESLEMDPMYSVNRKTGEWAVESQFA
jgi:hypothetical protein